MDGPAKAPASIRGFRTSGGGFGCGLLSRFPPLRRRLNGDQRSRAVQNSRIDIASGGPRIGGFVALALHCGSPCAIGSTAPGSALGGPGLRLVGSAVTIGLRPVTSPRAIAVASLKLDGARYGRCLIFPKGRSGETGELLVDQKTDQLSNVTFVRIVFQLFVNPLS